MDFGKIFLVTGYSSIQAFLLTGLTVIFNTVLSKRCREKERIKNGKNNKIN